MYSNGTRSIIATAPILLMRVLNSSQVKPRATPADGKRRQTISAGDVPGPQQQPLPVRPLSAPQLDGEEKGGGSSASEGGGFNVGVAGPAKGNNAKRRRSGV